MGTDTTTAPAIKVYGFQRKGHGLLVDRALSHGERAPRRFACSCGTSLGTSYDKPVFAAFRAHVKAAAVTA